MKSIASAIVVLAGIYGITESIPLLTMQPSPVPLLGMTAGIVTLALGLVGWWASLKYDR
jgi:divalent metal cation (Fe/Co/Zn/Cd) transporter